MAQFAPEKRRSWGWSYVGIVVRNHHHALLSPEVGQGIEVAVRGPAHAPLLPPINACGIQRTNMKRRHTKEAVLRCVGGSGTSMSVCAANSGEKGEGGERGFPPEGVLFFVLRRTST